MKLHLPVSLSAVALIAAALGDGHVVATHASAEQPANLTHAAAEIVRTDGRALISVFEIAGDGSNGNPGTVQPGVGVWDERVNHIVGDRQINANQPGALTTSKSGHDAPSIVDAVDGSVLVPYGAASTYHGYSPPAQWICGTSTCEPFKYAGANVTASALVDALANSPLYLLPASGLSEMSSASGDDATILAGQEQTGLPRGQAGAQGYVSYRRGGQFDTAAGPWDFRRGGAPAGDGLYTFTRTPNDNAYVTFAITNASGSGSVALDVDGTQCVFANVPAGSPEQAVAAFVQYANAACGAFSNRFEAIAVKYDPLERAQGPAVVGIALRRGDVATLPAAASIRLNCASGITCASPRGANTVYDERASGLHRHFLFGGTFHLGRYFYELMDVQQVTGSWFGPEHNSYALALACFRSPGPSGGTWTWTDCAGHHPFELRPGAPPLQRLGSGSPYLIGAPEGGYPNGFSAYSNDWSMQAQPPAISRTYPVISAESLAAVRNGHLIAVHACQTTSGANAICYAEIDPSNARTIRVGFVDNPSSGGSLVSLGLRTDGEGRLALGVLAGIGTKWGCIGSGGCAMEFRFDENQARWTRISALALGGANNSAFPGVVTASSHGFLYQYRDLLGEGHARIITFERPAP